MKTSKALIIFRRDDDREDKLKAFFLLRIPVWLAKWLTVEYKKSERSSV